MAEANVVFQMFKFLSDNEKENFSPSSWNAH